MIRGFAILLFFVVVILALLHSCANIKPPVGGPKDTIPPLIIETFPLNQTLKFKGDIIRMKFHEPIKVENLKKKLIITPRFEEFEYKSSKYEVIVSLLEPLADSTTYTFNFTDGVRDLNEGNIARDVALAFSTGDYIDSITLDGKVIDLFNNEVIAESVVALYSLEDTLDLFTGKPMYYARTNEKGVFRFENLRNEPYQLYAFTDVNNDLVADSRTELYGFKTEPVNQQPQDYGDTLIVHLSHLNVTDLELISSRPFQLYYDIKFVKSITDFQLTLIDSAQIMEAVVPIGPAPKTDSDSSQNTTELENQEPLAKTPFWDQKNLNIYGNYIPAQNLLRIFQTFPIKDSVAFRLWAIDSVGFEIDTTLYLEFRESNRAPLPFVTNFEPPDGQPVDNIFKGTYRFTKPIALTNYDSIFIEYDSNHIQALLPELDLSWNPSKTEMVVTKPLDIALIDTLAANIEKAEALRLEMQAKQKALLDSLRQIETDSLRKVLDDQGLSNTTVIDSLKGLKQTINNGQAEMDSLTMLALNHQLDSLVKYDGQQIERLRPKPPKPAEDTLTNPDLAIGDTLQTDSTVALVDSVELDDLGKSNKRKGLKLNLPKKKPEQVTSQVEEEPIKPMPPGAIRIFIATGSFISVEGDTSGSISRIYTLKDPAKLGLIKGKIQTQESKFTVQLLNNYYEVVLQQADQKEYEFLKVAPGDYYIRILVDQNQNGKWDPGNIHELIEPEPVIFYPQSIPVKENWELENELIAF